jgi:hypothetical protein
MIFRVSQIASRHAPKVASDLNIGFRRLIQPATHHQAYICIDNSFCRYAVDDARFQSEYIARQMKCADLTPSIGKQFVGPDGTLNYLIDIFSWLVLSVDFFVLIVGKLCGDEACITRDHTELIGCPAGNRAILGANNRWDE